MMSKQFLPLAVCCLLLSSMLLTSCQSETTKINTEEGPTEISSDELLRTIGEIYVYGYPLILMDLTQKVSTNIESPHSSRPLAPVNQLAHFRTFPDHNLTAIVKPNVDTYYSIAWLDLDKEPMVLSMPATERYYMMPIIDAYSNVVVSPGTRTTGRAAQNFLYAGPNWKGETPAGMFLCQSSTRMNWLLGRIQVNSPEDGATVVRALQDSMKLVPLSAFGKGEYLPAKGTVVEEYKSIIPMQTVQEIDINTYLNRVSTLMVDNPRLAADTVMAQKMKKIGFIPGKEFDTDIDNFILKTKIKAIPNFVHKKIKDRRANPELASLTNGWAMAYEGIGRYGTDYLRRAYIDFIGLGANIPEDAVYPNCVFDVNGERLDASKAYTIHFEKEELPPVRAFWSLTAYNEDEFLVKNDLNRFALGDRDDLVYNEDGSLDLFMQSELPKNVPEKNWLPIPASGEFFLTMRLYWPKESVLKGEWKPPVLVPIK